MEDSIAARWTLSSILYPLSSILNPSAPPRSIFRRPRSSSQELLYCFDARIASAVLTWRAGEVVSRAGRTTQRDGGGRQRTFDASPRRTFIVAGCRGQDERALLRG